MDSESEQAGIEFMDGRSGHRGRQSLSPREREVLALVAAGLTNRAISERLVISIGTTDRHVHNILAKLGCSTRTEAAAFARMPSRMAADGARRWRPELPHGSSATADTFVGRTAEMSRLMGRLAEAAAGSGGLTMVVGEPGIGKTRLTEEVAHEAARAGFQVFWGRCYEGDWTPPYVPFAEALTMLARIADLRELRSDLGFAGPPLSRIVPILRERVPDLPEPAALGPNEEQFRILDAVWQLLAATARRRPLLIVIDDLHWADAGTLNMLRYVSRFLKDSRVCLVGNYRDVELDRHHPLGDALTGLQRDSSYERLVLRGLEDEEVGELLTTIADRSLDGSLVEAIRRETGGNPLFIREILLHLIEEGKLEPDGEGLSTAMSAALAFEIPESVRQVIGRRLSRLPGAANLLLSAASAFNGPFRFDVAAEAAGLEEQAALDAVDAAVEAQLIHATDASDSYEFAHALIGHTLYTQLNPSRQVRLHRRIAEALVTLPEVPAAETAYQYHRSAALPGAGAGAAWALRAADEAQAAYGWEQVVAFSEMALEIMPADDERRAEVTGRLGHALPFVQRPEDAIAAMKLWAGALFERGRVADGLEYLMLGHRALVGGGYEVEGFELARFGRPWFLGNDHRPSVWLRLLLHRYEEETAPDYVGLTVGSPEKIQLFKAWDALPNLDNTTVHRSAMRTYGSRAEVLAWPRSYPLWPVWATFQAGEYQETEPMLAERATEALKIGLLDEAVQQLAFQASCNIALGNIAVGQGLLARATEIARRIPPGGGMSAIGARKFDLAMALNEGWERRNQDLSLMFEGRRAQTIRWAAAPLTGQCAHVKARLGEVEAALSFLERTVPAIAKCPGGAGNYTSMICNAASTLWELERVDFAEIIERNLLEKTIALDFRQPMHDGRLSLAQMCALQGRIGEASEWFARAREVLEEQGARPLRAICDYDEALALVRHSRKTSALLDRPRVRELLEKATVQFMEIGMTGWITRGETLMDEVR